MSRYLAAELYCEQVQCPAVPLIQLIPDLRGYKNCRDADTQVRFFFI
jgi:hypothetical protein